jgi:RsiW-degrading membrane proteinase PrsW (M82 family)
MSLTLALSGTIPAVVLMGVVDRADARRPEPRSVLRRAALYGGLATIPCIVLQLMMEGLKPAGVAGALFQAFVQAALTEESAKAIALKRVWNHPAFDERLDGIVYATRIGLGFALVENVGCLLGATTLSGFVGIWVMRAVLAVPGHAIYAGFTGYWAARRRFDGTGLGLLGGLAIAIFLHGSYDAALFLLAEVAERQPLLVLPLVAVPLAVVFFGYRRLRHHARQALALDDAAQARATARLPFGMGFVLR